MFSFNLSHILTFILTISITFYISKITQFSPVYFIYISVFFVALIDLIKYSMVSYTIDMLIALFLFMLLFLTQIEHMQSGEFINLSLALMAYIYIRAVKKRQDSDLILKTFNYMIWISIIILSIDSIYRIMHPGLPTYYVEHNEDMWFYLYKTNSIMFADSNSTALVSLILFFSVISFQKYYNLKSFRYAKLFLFGLVVFSFSRAAIISLIIGVGLEYVLKKKKLAKFILLNIGIILLTGLSFFFFQYFENDGSFNSKFQILSIAYMALEKSSFFELWFGHGLKTSVEDFGIYTHLLLITYLYEMGITALFLFLTFIVYYAYRYNTIVLLPVMIVSLSFFTYVGTPFFFVPLALIANLIDSHKIVNNEILISIVKCKQ